VLRAIRRCSAAGAAAPGGPAFRGLTAPGAGWELQAHGRAPPDADDLPLSSARDLAGGLCGQSEVFGLPWACRTLHARQSPPAEIEQIKPVQIARSSSTARHKTRGYYTRIPNGVVIDPRRRSYERRHRTILRNGADHRRILSRPEQIVRDFMLHMRPRFLIGPANHATRRPWPVVNAKLTEADKRFELLVLFRAPANGVRGHTRPRSRI
jgi:hypothetical protein